MFGIILPVFRFSFQWSCCFFKDVVVAAADSLQNHSDICNNHIFQENRMAEKLFEMPLLAIFPIFMQATVNRSFLVIFTAYPNINKQRVPGGGLSGVVAHSGVDLMQFLSGISLLARPTNTLLQTKMQTSAFSHLQHSDWCAWVCIMHFYLNLSLYWTD